jgi:hypothetical protein
MTILLQDDQALEVRFGKFIQEAPHRGNEEPAGFLAA